MELLYSVLINLIFYVIVIEILIGVLFYFIGLSRRLLLNSISMLLMITPLYLKYNRIIEVITLSFPTLVGLCLFPVTLAVMIKHHYLQYRQTSMIPVYILSAISFFTLAVFPDYNGLIIYVAHFLFYTYILYIIYPGRHELASVLLLWMIFINFIYISVTVYTLNEIHFILSAGMMNVAVSFLLGYNLRNRIVNLLNQFNVINELNNKLYHRLARLKQSNDSCLKIILEKDLELSQMARHASLAELTTGIAHELSQPLTGIKGISQNMIDDINAEEFENLQGVSELMKICALVDKSASIIDHIRNFSKKSTLSIKQIDLNKVILEAIDLIRYQLKKNNIDLIFVLDDAIPRILGDKLSLEQLIVNILMNSKDAILEKQSSSPEDPGTIRITTFSDEQSVSMIIQDNGSGISEDIMNKIWSPFFTTKKREHGTGIGLSICNKILKDHKATVDIQSDSSGTQFSIQFPLEQAQGN
ncbi:MAG TPA: ATP-binding protein [Spirochaetota bacterium]|nr:ATP-binding protein [Spirochaetota bacterium]